MLLARQACRNFLHHSIRRACRSSCRCLCRCSHTLRHIGGYNILRCRMRSHCRRYRRNPLPRMAEARENIASVPPATSLRGYRTLLNEVSPITSRKCSSCHLRTLMNQSRSLTQLRSAFPNYVRLAAPRRPRTETQPLVASESWRYTDCIGSKSIPAPRVPEGIRVGSRLGSVRLALSIIFLICGG